MSNKLKKSYFIPFIAFLVLITGLLLSLYWQHRALPSPLLNQPAPPLNLPNLSPSQQPLTQHDWEGNLALINVWATWCASCIQEHPFLSQLARTKSIAIYGLDYKDDPKSARNWLKRYGNPYTKVGYDLSGNAAINWGVYGTPETFLLDSQGIIRYKYIGPLSQQVWNEKFLPIIRQYQ